MDLSTIQPRQSERSRQLAQDFQRLIDSLPVHNVFNPSFYQGSLSGGVATQVWAFRAIVRGERELAAFFAVDGDVHRLDHLTPPVDAPRLIDPKVFRLEDRLYLTFNSGWVPPRNHIFVMQVAPELGRIKQVVYPGRRGQERNWAFFQQAGQTYALYWLNPLRILRLEEETEDAWVMEDEYLGPLLEPESGTPDDVTLGTQLSETPEGYRFVGHRKVLVAGNKKLYLGRAGSFDPVARTVSSSGPWLIHSLESLFGSEIKHNGNLHSCTYFSGIQTAPDETLVAYGVNDVDYGFASI
ncbi:MAG: hypothetical protein AAF560_30300 [Acidobacteriota bacterium]